MAEPEHGRITVSEGKGKELTSMATKTSKTTPKRLSKSQRIHARRLKQAARKAGTTHS
jgi:hypothetical protein